MKPNRTRLFTGGLRPWMVVLMASLVVIIFFTSYRAIAGWRESARMLADRRAQTAVDLLVTAATRDMRGVQTLVLASAVGHPTDEIGDVVASAFARYPYPEVFFAWRARSAVAEMVFFARAERQPTWLAPAAGDVNAPIFFRADAALAARLMQRIDRDAAQSRRLAVFDIEQGGHPYQAIVQLSYAGPLQDRLISVFGFLVNLDWVRSRYFSEIANQLRGIDEMNAGVLFRVRDEAGVLVVGERQETSNPTRARALSLAFFDPVVIVPDPPPDLAVHTWMAEASIAADPVLAAANRGATQTLVISSLAVIILVAGFLATARAVSTNASLARMRADFMVAITHELKTPVASVRALTETLASGRVSSLDMSRHYGRLATHEAKRLGRLIDNLLAHARITDVAEVYLRETVGADVLIDDTLHDFATQLEQGGFDVDVELAPDLPQLRVDRTSMRLALGNIVDNAIRYSGTSRFLQVHAATSNGTGVVIEVADRGVGIPPEEVPHVSTKFFRGRRAVPGGNGLGLAIAQRIVADHSGTLDIESTVDTGTSVRITLPYQRV